MPQVQLDNEEEVKNKVIVPLLLARGLNLQDIQFESSFEIRAAKQRFTVGGLTREESTGHIRLDILVKSQGANLLVVEVKGPDIKLSARDGDQAVSYARLVHPMAPFALVTNGADSRLFDVAAWKEVSELVRTDGLQVVLPGPSDIDALTMFLRLSSENVKKFSRAQVDSGLSALKGSAQDLSRKYIPSLYVAPSATDTAFAEFEESRLPVFGLIGDSGMGKTCWMCHAASALIDSGRPALFFRGSELGSDLAQAIADEFAWTFPSLDSPAELLRQLRGVLQEKTLSIFIDGIDEWECPTARQQLGKLARNISGDSIRLIVSSKPGEWSSFLEHRGAATDFSEHVWPREGRKGCSLETLSAPEFSKAMDLYAKEFGFDGAWDESLLSEARRSPFFMRIAFQVAQSRDLLHLRESARSIFDSYLNQTLNRTSDPASSRTILETVAAALYKQNRESLPTLKLRKALMLGPLDKLPDELFKIGVLEISRPTETGQTSVRFMFDVFRNYLIAVLVLRWPELTASEFSEQMRSSSRRGLQEDVLLSYYRLAAPGHKREVDGRIFAAGEKYLSAYRTIIRENFGAFARVFPPGDLDQCGLVVAADLSTSESLAVGLRMLEGGDEEVLVLHVPATTYWGDAFARYGAGGISFRWSPNWLVRANPHFELLRVTIPKLLLQFVGDGHLNESSAPMLAVELLSAAAISMPELLNVPNRGAGNEQLPVSGTRILYWLSFSDHWEALRSEVEGERIRTGELAVAWLDSGSMSFETYEPFGAEEADLIQKCDLLARSGAKCSSRSRREPFDSLAGRLRQAISDLPSAETPVAPPFERCSLSGTRRGGRPTLLEDGQFVGEFLKAFIACYAGLVSLNFPTISAGFELYRRLPVLVRFAIRDQREAFLGSGRSLSWEVLVPEDGKLDASRVVQITPEEIDLRRCWDEPVDFEGRRYLCFHYRNQGVWGFERSRPRSKLSRQIDSRLTVLRDFTYEWIEKELARAYEGLGARYGVEGLELSR